MIVQLSDFTLDLARSALCAVQAFQQNRGPEHVGFLNAFRYLVWQSVYSVFVVLNSMLLLLGMFNVLVNFVKFTMAESCAVSVIRNSDEQMARSALLLVEIVVLCGLLGLAWITVYAPFFSLQYSVLRYMIFAVSMPLYIIKRSTALKRLILISMAESNLSNHNLDTSSVNTSKRQH